MTTPFVVPFYAAIFALIYVILAIRVARLRRQVGVMLGESSDPRLQRAICVHGNFAEYVPFALLLLGFAEAQRNSIYVLHILCLLLLIGRLSHACGVAQVEEKILWRIVGISLTWLVLIVAAAILIWDFFRILPTV
jgi:uncharacterized membrane protein YecN with MAPEG domain